ncbi:glycosyltransferase family 4 protein [Alsobacter sp. SYSU M60028]|uniref:Glycosyltransferase family 4 protein n=1 Tax=Alsobacter ponti TaxID=2962936 RepID=A0ABT1LCI4_9HYPH|nr:glycosyltransferase family 4 protein [Alsobacter ponti]MCP8939205.1 glycosyltransferase family 4 protein [Alsobacter ponti]
MTRVAFLAPLKPPDHPEPSGDREMARLLLRALHRAGCEPSLASRLRMLDRHGDAGLEAALEREARTEAEALLSRYAGLPRPQRPDLVFTYHVHYKAPDVIGPALARGLGVPYVVAEGSRAPKRANGPWARFHALAEAALDAADLVLVLNEGDREMLERARPARQALAEFPPFLDTEAWPIAPRRPRDPAGPARLIAVAMMRQGDKLASYAALAQALAGLPEAVGWTLDIVGDGPARGEVEALFAPFGARARLHGLVSDRDALAALYAAADLLVWPAVNEAYGMVFLEAALQGCPALAGACGGVPGVVADGRTGVLTPPGDVAAFRDTLAGLVAEPARLALLSRHGPAFVQGRRSLAGAAERLRGLLSTTLEAASPRARAAGPA